MACRCLSRENGAPPCIVGASRMARPDGGGYSSVFHTYLNPRRRSRCRPSCPMATFAQVFFQ
eukprot:329991-Pyramimonas_sp.AAC.1